MPYPLRTEIHRTDLRVCHRVNIRGRRGAFGTEMVELRHEVAELRAENIELRREVGYWKSMHARVVGVAVAD